VDRFLPSRPGLSAVSAAGPCRGPGPLGTLKEYTGLNPETQLPYLKVQPKICYKDNWVTDSTIKSIVLRESS